MATIRQDDFIQSIADALQHISYYHPLDYIRALGEAYEREQGPAAKDAIAQILTNSRMCAEGHRPICQDTGIVVVFLKVGMEVRWDATLSVQEMVDEGVRRAYLLPENVLRASIVADLSGRGLTLLHTGIGNRAGFAHAFAQGLGITEAAPRSTGARELRALLDEVMELTR